MAHSVTHTPSRFSLFGLIANFATRVNSALTRMAEAQTRVRQVEFLQSLSDEELHKRGLTRDRIAEYVFRGAYHT